MKKISFLIVLLFCSIQLFGQSGYRENRFYKQQYNITEICDNRTYYNYCYDSYGRQYACNTYIICKTAKWHSRYGRRQIWVWGPYGWYTTWYEGRYYWYTWYTYKKYY